MSVKQIWMHSCHTAAWQGNRFCSIKWCVCWISADLWLLIITLCCINVSHINNYWQNSSCQIKVTDGWGGGIPHVQSSPSQTSSYYSQKRIKYKTDTIYHGAQLTSGVPSTVDMFAVGSTWAVTPKNELLGEKVHVAATNKDLFTPLKGLCCWQIAGKCILESKNVCYCNALQKKKSVQYSGLAL